MSKGSPLNLVLVGPPGAGKGTQAKLLSKRFDIPQISTGEILRAAVKEKTLLGLKAKDLMDRGGLVTDEIAIGIVEERLGRSDCENGFILDGFPRTIKQAYGLKKMLGVRGKGIDHVFFIDVDKEDLLARITGRLTCRGCGKGFHVIFNPPKASRSCDGCGGELYRREDDREEAIRNRLDIFRQQTSPLISYYAEAGLLRTIIGSGLIGDIQRRFLEIIEDRQV